jgi:uncharacterized protein YecE (DUF72 family)
MKKLKDVETPLANFFASACCASGTSSGTILWQFPPGFAPQPRTLRAVLRPAPPRDTTEAAKLAKRHDRRLKGARVDKSPCEATDPSRGRDPPRVFQGRPKFVKLLRGTRSRWFSRTRRQRWPYIEDLTAPDFVYARLHGERRVCDVSGYTDAALDWWSGAV